MLFAAHHNSGPFQNRAMILQNLSKTPTILIAMALLSMVACNEKAAQPQAHVGDSICQQNPGDTACASRQKAGECNENGDCDPSGNSAAYDACEDLLVELSENILAKELCDNISSLENSAYVGSGSTKIIHDPEPTQKNNRTIFHVRSAVKVTAEPEDYFAMLQLQYKDKSKFAEVFDVAKDNDGEEYVDINDVTYGNKQATFVYTNSKRSDTVIKYKATTKFFVLKENVAYATSTTSNNSFSEKAYLENLKGIVLIKKSGSDIYIISVSDQTYASGSDHDQWVSNVKSELAAEQRRSYKNAKKAYKAPELLTN